jgi:hypothetical protein
MSRFQTIAASIASLIGLMSMPPLPLERSEAEWRAYFDDKVVPLRARLLKTKIGDVRQGDWSRAHLVVSGGTDVLTFVQALQELTPFTAQHVCAYIDREIARLN